jgi:ATPase subunit of ABC transporter with duplicated ATPase domains
LERYLYEWKSTLMVISHEPTLLNEVADHIVSLID